MMLSEPCLDEIRARWGAVRDLAVEIAGDDGHAKLLGGHGASQVELRVRRERDHAGDGDVLFVGHAFSDIPRLLGALGSGSRLSAEDAAESGTPCRAVAIERRIKQLADTRPPLTHAQRLRLAALLLSALS
jgi:hypothetical protein